MAVSYTHLDVYKRQEHTGGVVARLALLLVTLAVAVFFYRVFHPTRGVVAHLRRQANPALLFRLQPLWFPALVATPFVILASTLNGYVYSAVIMMHSLLLSLWLACGLVLLHGLVWRWLTLLRQNAGYQIASNECTGESATDAAVGVTPDEPDGLSLIHI